MAFQVEKIHPLDLQPRKAVGVSIPFSAKDVFNSTYTTQEALKSNLINYFLTGKGERFLNPNLGTGLRALLFSQMTEDKKEEISYEVRKGVADWFPNVVVNDLQVGSSPDTHTVVVYLNYSVSQTNIQDELVINFEQ
jgi:phage baseplate assembly protein W